jgi:hypothetical protein
MTAALPASEIIDAPRKSEPRKREDRKAETLSFLHDRVSRAASGRGDELRKEP